MSGPEAIHKTAEVYGINRDLPLNYVVRDNVDGRLVNELTRDKHVIVYGSSKQGKTSLRKKCLNDDDYVVIHCSNRWTLADLHSAILKTAGYEVVQSTTRTTTGTNKISATVKASVLGIGGSAGAGRDETTTTTQAVQSLDLDPQDVNDIISALNNAGFNKYIILEDFHYLSIETQKDFAVSLKAFHEQSEFCFIVIGVWLEEGRLTVYNGDLTGRVVSVNADAWTRSELREVVSVGEALLNIKFADSFIAELLEGCFDSVYIVQEACYQACVKSKVYETQATNREIAADLSAKEIITEVVGQQTGRYNSFITQFGEGFQETALQMYRWLLYPILIASSKELEQGLRYRQLRDVLRSKHPEGKTLNPGNLTQALQATASLQVKKDIKPIVLDYDQTNLILNVVDKGFLIWLDNQNRKDLLELADLPTE
jgi:hypothetical protein